MRRLLILVAGTLIGLAALVGVVYALTPIPDSTQASATAQGSVIYYNDGKTVLAQRGVDRDPVPLRKVPKHVRNAVIAAENRGFYSDQGVSLRGSIRAVWSTITGQQVQGGSTITQQMVRNYYSGLSQERSVIRKLREILISVKVDQSKSKDWVLEQYLNTIYFGRGAHGIQAASKAYFRKDVSDLTVAEGAYLAAVIQQPSRFADPEGDDLDAAKSRWNSVIGAMTETGALTAEKAASLDFPTLRKPRAVMTLGGQRGYMWDQVHRELNRLGYDDETINQGGLKVTTTFDRKLMDVARRAVEETRPSGTSRKVRTGLAAVDPATGEVVAFYGGDDYLKNQYDNAFSAKVQAGSSFKPYALAAALEEGYGLGTIVQGDSPLMVNGTAINNSGMADYGPVDLVTATQRSINTAYVELAQKVGVNKVAEMAEDMGIPAAQVEQHKYATLPLGVADVSAVQQASAYATFAAGGVHRDAHVVRSVTDAKGETREIKVKTRRVFSERTAADATYAMTQVVRGGTGTAAALPDGRPVAGKTGTSSDAKSVWFVGYTPQLAVAVDMFHSDNKTITLPGYGEAAGGTVPAMTFRAFTGEALRGEPVKRFQSPSGADRSGGTRVNSPRPQPEHTPRPRITDEPTPDPEPTSEPPATQSPAPPPETDGPDGPQESERPRPPSPDQPDDERRETARREILENPSGDA
ncbi:transglycosylase domain-containing protein [Bailinhaonella thermotolerans]|uniref:Carboxypeptidase n=1 Tax=Bailinhaonella thermotolerans TaxID=1070861 RepID=A0A3A4BQA5_9ACTN|nr:transglycosylase domain-containing protein [Bailinhaonella thermotolerans]RJL33326.1 carboxypeptidase [Bailinhaonella thermotolerans]